MKSGGSKAKGAEFERLICKKLSKWITGGERDDVLWRSAMSGGRATVQIKKGMKAEAHAGDISSTHWLGSFLTETFSLELKAYADLGYTSSMTKRKGALITFWGQTVRDASLNNKLPMLIAKQNRQPTVIALSREGVKVMQLAEYPLLAPLGSLNPEVLPRMYLYNLEEFIEATDPTVLELACGHKITKSRSPICLPS